MNETPTTIETLIEVFRSGQTEAFQKMASALEPADLADVLRLDLVRRRAVDHALGEPVHRDVEVAIGTEHAIPQNAVPKIFRRGLGSSFLSFALPSERRR